MPRKRQSIDQELGKQLFGNLLGSLIGKQAPRQSAALDVLIGEAGQEAAPDTLPDIQPAEPASGPAAPAIRLIGPDGVAFPIDTLPALIGRRASRRSSPPDVDLSDVDPLQSVSRRHAYLERDAQGDFTLRVEISPPPTNPVVLDGESLFPGQQRPLRDGAAVQIGLVQLEFRAS